MGLLLTQALARIELNKKKLAKKRTFVTTYCSRFNFMVDPFEKDGGVETILVRELQAIADLEQSIIDLRRSIAKANDETMVTVGDVTKSIADWLIWKREVVASQNSFVKQLIQRVQQGRTESENKQRQASDDEKEHYQLIVHVNEKGLHDRAEQLESILGDLDAELSIKNATVTVDYGEGGDEGTNDEVNALQAAYAKLYHDAPWTLYGGSRGRTGDMVKDGESGSVDYGPGVIIESGSVDYGEGVIITTTAGGTSSDPNFEIHTYDPGKMVDADPLFPQEYPATWEELKDVPTNEEEEIMFAGDFKLYEVAVVEEPTVHAMEAGEEPKLVLPPTAVIAREEKAAIAIATSNMDAKMTSRTKVLVRGFTHGATVSR